MQYRTNIERNEIIEEGSWMRAASAKLFTCFARLHLSTLHLFVNPVTIHQLAQSENLPFSRFFSSRPSIIISYFNYFYFWFGYRFGFGFVFFYPFSFSILFFFFFLSIFSSSRLFTVTRTSRPSNSIFAALVHRFICNLHHLPSIHSVTDTTRAVAAAAAAVAVTTATVALFFLEQAYVDQWLFPFQFQFQN